MTGGESKRNAIREELSEKDIYQFMPAAVEIERTPASPAGRAILYAIVLLFLFAVLWAVFGKIDIVAVAEGKVVPSERVKIIQPMETATIAGIHVKEGEEVQAGELLVTLDSEMVESDLRRFTEEWLDAKAQRLRLEALVHWFQLDGAPDEFDVAGDSELGNRVDRQNALLREEIAEHRATLNALQRQGERLDAEWQMAEAEIDRSKRILQVLGERVDALDTMQKMKMGSRADYLELRQSQIEIEGQIGLQQAIQRKLEASMAANLAEQQTYRHESYKTALGQLQSVRVNESTLREEKTKAEKRHGLYYLRAPMDGKVQQLAVHTVGGVVTPAQELMLIVPDQGELEVEAMILNKDIGFVQEGQPAEVKVNTFNFTKYGSIAAELVGLSKDAIETERQGLVYKSLFRLREGGLIVNGNYVALSPGMSVTAEIKTGQRRIIEFFLSPLLRYKEESLGER